MGVRFHGVDTRQLSRKAAVWSYFLPWLIAQLDAFIKVSNLKYAANRSLMRYIYRLFHLSVWILHFCSIYCSKFVAAGLTGSVLTCEVLFKLDLRFASGTESMLEWNSSQLLRRIKQWWLRKQKPLWDLTLLLLEFSTCWTINRAFTVRYLHFWWGYVASSTQSSRSGRRKGLFSFLCLFLILQI